MVLGQPSDSRLDYIESYAPLGTHLAYTAVRLRMMFLKKAVMGWTGLGTTPNDVEHEASRRNSRIDGLLKSERKVARKTTNVLLLGTCMGQVNYRMVC